jgi:hypothetical protein
MYRYTIPAYDYSTLYTECVLLWRIPRPVRPLEVTDRLPNVEPGH